MKRVHVFVEGQTHEEFLCRVLPAELTKETQFVNAGAARGSPPWRAPSLSAEGRRLPCSWTRILWTRMSSKTAGRARKSGFRLPLAPSRESGCGRSRDRDLVFRW